MKNLLLIACLLCAPAFAERMTEPKIDKYPTPEGEIIVVRIPIQQLKRSTEFQTCFVWRDRNGQVQMQCPSEQSDETKRDAQK